MQLTESQKDMFGELGNVGIGCASTALSSMLNNRRVNISLPETNIVKKNEMINEKGVIILVDSKLEGDLTGNLIVIYNKGTAFPLIDMLLGQEEGTLKEIDEMAKSVFKEMVNIIAGPYLDSLANMSGLRILPQPPTFSFGEIISIKDTALIKLPNVEEVISIKTEMSVDGRRIFGSIFLVLDNLSLNKLLKIFSEKQ